MQTDGCGLPVQMPSGCRGTPPGGGDVWELVAYALIELLVSFVLGPVILIALMVVFALLEQVDRLWRRPL